MTKQVRRILKSLYRSAFRRPSVSREGKRSLQLESLEVREMLTAVGFHSVQDASEGGQAGYVRIERTDTIGDLAVHYELDYKNNGEHHSNYEGHAKNGTDFQWLPGTNDWQNCGIVTFLDGQQYVDIAIVPIDDDWLEGNEQVAFKLTDPSQCYYCYGSPVSYSIDSDHSATTVNIIDDDTPIYVWVDSTQDAVEGGENGFVRLRRDDVTKSLTVHYMLDSRNSGDHYGDRQGWAQNGVDFQALPGTGGYGRYGNVTFATGAEYAYIEIVPIDDIYVEDDESVKITLMPTAHDESGYGQIGKTYLLDDTKTEGVVTIVDDDPEVTVRIDTVQDAFEGERDGYFRLWRDNTERSLVVHFELDYRNAGYYESHYAGWAKNGTDFQWIPGTYDYENFSSVTFVAGQEYVDIPIHVIDDNWYEGTEQVGVNLLQRHPWDYVEDGAVTYRIDPEARSKILLIHDDEIRVTVGIETIRNGTEGGENALVRIYRDETSVATTVYYEVGDHNTGDYYNRASGWAQNGIDFGLLPGTNTYDRFGSVEFAVGRSYIDIPIVVVDDTYIEGTEQLVLTLRQSPRDDYGTPQGVPYLLEETHKTATVSIFDNDDPVTVRIDSVQNGVEGGQDGYFRLHRDNTANEIIVYYGIARNNAGPPYYLGQAMNGVDFQTLPGFSPGSEYGFVTFRSDEEYVDIPITVIDDLKIEGDEKVTAFLMTASEYEYYHGSMYGNVEESYSIDATYQRATLTVEDNDQSLVWFEPGRDAYEGGEDGYVQLRRDKTVGSLTVRYSTDRFFSTATAGEDYEELSGTATFESGVDTIRIPIKALEDDILEYPETVLLKILDAPQNAVGGSYYEPAGPEYKVDSSRRDITVKIHDNEPVPMVWVDSTAGGTEGVEDGHVRLRRSDATGPLRVKYRIDSSSTAVPGDDFDYLPGMGANSEYGFVTFEAGSYTADIRIRVIDDLVVEPTETVSITLLPDGQPSAGAHTLYEVDSARSTGVASIFDNDAKSTVWIETVQNAVEGGAGGFFRLHRTEATGPLTIHYQFDAAGSTAVMGVDFARLPGMVEGSTLGSVAFAAGVYEVDIPVLIHDDTLKRDGQPDLYLTTSYTYDADGNKLSETDWRGNVTTYTYNSYGQLTSSTSGGVTTYTNYNAQTGLPTSTTDVNGNTTRYNFDDKGNMTSLVNSEGVQLITSTYNKYGEVTSITSIGGRTTYMTYDLNGDCIESYYVEDGMKVLDKTFYDEARRVVGRERWLVPVRQGVSPLGSTGTTTAEPKCLWSTQTVYTPTGQVAVEVDQNGLMTEYLYDIRGLQIEVRTETKDSAGNSVWYVQRTVYDAAGRAVYSTESFRENTDEPIRGTKSVYDADGRVIRSESLLGLVIDVTGTSSRSVREGEILDWNETVYNNAGWVLESTDRHGLRTQYKYNEFGETTQTRRELSDGTWLVNETVYDEKGRVVFSTDSHLDGTSEPIYGTETIYDTQGRAVRTIRYANCNVAVDDATGTSRPSRHEARNSTEARPNTTRKAASRVPPTIMAMLPPTNTTTSTAKSPSTNRPDCAAKRFTTATVRSKRRFRTLNENQMEHTTIPSRSSRSIPITCTVRWSRPKPMDVPSSTNTTTSVGRSP